MPMARDDLKTPNRKPNREEMDAAYGNTVPDVIAPRLKVLFVGVNPSLYSAAVGHHFARPGNRFWPALHAAGWTDRRLTGFEDGQLPDYGCGITNFVERATARADELSAEELKDGVRRLNRKVAQYRIACVAFLGITAYRTAFHRKRVVVGRQDGEFGGAAVWVLPNPSGLNAHYQLPDFTRLFKRLRSACQ